MLNYAPFATSNISIDHKNIPLQGAFSVLWQDALAAIDHKLQPQGQTRWSDFVLEWCHSQYWVQPTHRGSSELRLQASTLRNVCVQLPIAFSLYKGKLNLLFKNIGSMNLFRSHGQYNGYNNDNNIKELHPWGDTEEKRGDCLICR
jgi:hypothetical protein